MPGQMPPLPDVQNIPMNSVEQQVYEQQGGMQRSSDNYNSENSTGDFSQLASMISDLDRRLRVLEERYSNLRKKLQLTDENILDSERTFNREIHAMNDESLSIKKQVHEFSEKLTMFGTELENAAQKKDLKVIEKYLLMWSPTNYVSRKELKEYLENKGMIEKEDEENP